MYLSTTAAQGQPDLHNLASGRLGVPAIVSFVLSAAGPLTVVAGVVTTAFATTGLTGAPLAFVLVGLVLAVFSSGYAAMARRVANAGEPVWRRLVARAIAAVMLTVMTYLALANLAPLLGVPNGHLLAWAAPALYLAVAVLGVNWGLTLKQSGPAVHATIDLGAKAVTLKPPTTAPASSTWRSVQEAHR